MSLPGELATCRKNGETAARLAFLARPGDYTCNPRSRQKVQFRGKKLRPRLISSTEWAKLDPLRRRRPRSAFHSLSLCSALPRA